MNDYKYKVKWCPNCNQGWVQIVKEKITNKLFLCCSECETEWTEPTSIDNKNGTHDNFGQTTLPSIEEIEERGWGKYVVLR